ncbi:MULTISPECIES: hypothetical protein [Caproicibacterium]|uniref:Uncharacterized protein n=1 Tax=Caproicibacterium argilliputei TaxID=3030016 RepID=A0AA97DCN9_9FIRM|nr:hypothetical protein [Caproicibacterium argilliputei]WOC33051.1 hypothetical protein PXC00_04005 [Caproicibacterium argilliputei]
MPVVWKTVKNDFPKMEAAVKNLNDRSVEVSSKGENAWLAGIHEYGCHIKVTEKMRAWFARNGYPLKKTTTEIVIPERSFLRAGFDEYAEDVVDVYEDALGNTLGGTMPVELFLQGIGLELATKIKKYARDLSSPPDSRMTTERKGSSNPLVDTGSMIESISYEVK